MKKLHIWMTIAGIIGVLLPFLVYAQTWHTADSISIAWDAVTATTGTITYKVYTQPHPSGTITNVATLPETQATISFAVEGKYILGVAAVRTIDEEVLESEISWSNDPIACLNNETFGAKYYVHPNKPKNIRKQ